MNSMSFFIIFIPILSLILLGVNLLLAPHNPYQEKNSVFECGFHSFLGQNRTQFSISFFIFALLFLLFDLEILLVYPYTVSNYINDIYGLIIMFIFFVLLGLGFVFELGKKALNISSKQTTITSKKTTTIEKAIAIRTVHSIPKPYPHVSLPLESSIAYGLSLKSLWVIIKRGIIACSVNFIFTRLVSYYLEVDVFVEYTSIVSIIYYIIFSAFIFLLTKTKDNTIDKCLIGIAYIFFISCISRVITNYLKDSYDIEPLVNILCYTISLPGIYKLWYSNVNLIDLINDIIKFIFIEKQKMTITGDNIENNTPINFMMNNTEGDSNNQPDETSGNNNSQGNNTQNNGNNESSTNDNNSQNNGNNESSTNDNNSQNNNNNQLNDPSDNNTQDMGMPSNSVQGNNNQTDMPNWSKDMPPAGAEYPENVKEAYDNISPANSLYSINPNLDPVTQDLRNKVVIAQNYYRNLPEKALKYEKFEEHCLANIENAKITLRRHLNEVSNTNFSPETLHTSEIAEERNKAVNDWATKVAQAENSRVEATQGSSTEDQAVSSSTEGIVTEPSAGLVEGSATGLVEGSATGVAEPSAGLVGDPDGESGGIEGSIPALSSNSYTSESGYESKDESLNSAAGVAGSVIHYAEESEEVVDEPMRSTEGSIADLDSFEASVADSDSIKSSVPNSVKDGTGILPDSTLVPESSVGQEGPSSKKRGFEDHSSDTEQTDGNKKPRH